MKKIFYTTLFLLSASSLFGQCPNTTAQLDLDINNVRARILNGGDLWWDPVGQTPYYEVPIGSGKNSIYAGAIWIGGVDNLGQIKTAAQTYRQAGANDFWAGPISRDTVGPSYGQVSTTTCTSYDRFFTVTKAEVQTFIQGGIASQNIIDWPGNGDVANGELQYLAPFFDANNDGIYDHTQGDYPYFNFSGNYAINPVTGQPDCDNYLFGDKSIWWVFNDVGNVKTETMSPPIGLEIRAQAFAFSSPDVDINNSTFYQYQVINRSSDSLLDAFIGFWCDADLGNPVDDYVGCDVGLNMGYVYNGDTIDAGASGYGAFPPALGIDFLRGPEADPNDGIDNDGNGITDEPGEQCLMTRFMYYSNVNNQPNGNPGVNNDYYNYLQAHWLDNQPITFGEDGRNFSNPVTHYMFSNGTDPAFPGQVWTMGSAGILPGDMRWIQSAGPFTMAPGEVNYLKTAVVWAQSTTPGPMASLTALLAANQSVQALFNNCFTVSLSENEQSISVQVSPNPFTSECTLIADEIKGRKVTVKVFDISGKLMSTYSTDHFSGSYKMGSELIAGTYLVKIESADKSFTGKVIKL